MEDDEIEFLLSIGAIEIVGVDEGGKDIYRMTEEAKDLVPELYEEHMKDFHMAVFSLWSKEIIDVVFDDAGEPLIGLNKNSENVEKTKDLSENEQEALQEMISYWKKKSEE